MSKVITFRIQGRGAETDAPTADDLLDQIRDYIGILHGVESALAEDGLNAVEWRVVNASRNSPLSFTIEAFPKQYAVNIDRRVEVVVRHTAAGLAALEREPTRPLFFDDETLDKAVRIFKRVTNGLAVSEADFGPGLPAQRVTASTAGSAARNAMLAQQPEDRPYRELGAVEGHFHSVEKDGYGRRLLWIRRRLNGEKVKCILAGNALSVIGQHQIDEVFHGRRLLVVGTINYKAIGAITQIDATDVQFFPARADLPSIDDVLDEDFTGGMTTEEFLARMRDGRLT